MSPSPEDLNKCGQRQTELIEAYRQDFSKYIKKYQIKNVELIFNEIPRLMGRKFKYSRLAGNWRKRELASALDILIKANFPTINLRKSKILSDLSDNSRKSCIIQKQ
jgi:hypothetical protein